MQSAPPTSHESIFEVLDDNSRGRVRAEGKGVYRQARAVYSSAREGALGGEHSNQNPIWRGIIGGWSVFGVHRRFRLLWFPVLLYLGVDMCIFSAVVEVAVYGSVLFSCN